MTETENTYDQLIRNTVPEISPESYQFPLLLRHLTNESQQHNFSNSYLQELKREICQPRRKPTLEDILNQREYLPSRISRENERGSIQNHTPFQNNLAEYNMMQLRSQDPPEHTPEYFAEQAMKMRGHIDRRLAGALERFYEGEDYGGGITQHMLEKFKKKDEELPAAEIEKYGITLDMQGEGSHYGIQFRLKYFDTPFNFCLTYYGNLIASVGFRAGDGKMCIEQVQGIAGSREQLKPIKWERMLVHLAIEWAKKNGIPEVTIVSAENNLWSKMHGHLSPEQGKMLYDITARRSGFKQAEDGNYVMQIAA